jgi:hypothetical protein
MGKEIGIKLTDGFEKISLFIDRSFGKFIIEKGTWTEMFSDGSGGFSVPEAGDILIFH